MKRKDEERLESGNSVEGTEKSHLNAMWGPRWDPGDLNKWIIMKQTFLVYGKRIL